VGSSLSSELLNYTEEKLSHWKRVLLPKSLTPTNLSVLLPASAIPTTGKGQLEEKVIASKKIRFYPENIIAYNEALTLYRRAYNLAVECYTNEKHIDENGKFKNLRPQIKAQCKEEQEAKGAIYNSIIVDNAVLQALTTFKAVMSKNKKLKGLKSGFASLKFKSRKGSKHSFSMDRMPKGLNPANRVLGKIHLTESVPNEAINKSCIITYDKGRWFIQVQQHINIHAETQGDVKCVAIDPGVRTFATCYSESEVIIAGDDFAKEVLFPLMKKVDNLLSKKKLIENTGQIEEKWYQEKIFGINKKIDRLKAKKDDLLLDLHNRLAYDLVQKYDIIFLPTFETQKMSKKQGRRIRRRTTREMLSLGHYEFKLRIKWYAKKYGKHVVDCNESYTSKTRSWDGTIDSKLGGKKVIRDDTIIVDRDINAARGILLKQLNKAA
jgi:putative transposase